MNNLIGKEPNVTTGCEILLLVKTKSGNQYHFHKGNLIAA